MSVTEIGTAEVPLKEGYVGNLTPEQEDMLRQMWLNFFQCCNDAKGSGTGASEAKAEGWGDADPKKSQPKGDAAKEEAKKKEEEEALKSLLSSYGSDALRETFWKFIKADNPDTDMLRFLRARKWDVSRATAMLAGCLKWRLDTGVEKLAEAGDIGNEKIEKFLDQQRSGKTYALGTAKNEQPICMVHVRKHFTFGQPGASMQKYIAAAMEGFRLLIVPPNDKVVLIFDMTGFGLRNMDWNCILYLLKCFEAYYPESLHVLYIHNAPWIFSGIWKILGPMLDPVVRAKIAFTSKAVDMVDNVPPERLLAELGGEMVDVFEFPEPGPNDDDVMKDTATAKAKWDAYMKLADEYEAVTKEWATSGKGDEKVSEKRKLLVKKLRVAQFDAEPYQRGKLVQHRARIIDGQGIVTWEYQQKSGDVIRHIVGRRHCVSVMKREISEIESRKSTKEVEEKTAKADAAADWTTLYGSEEEARRIEGERVDGKVPPKGTRAFLSAMAPPGQSAPAAPAAEAPAEAKEVATEAPAKVEDATEFKDAPEADSKAVETAVNGDTPAAQVEAEQPAVVAPEATPASIPADSQAPATNGDAKAEEPTDYSGDKTGTLGRRFSKLLGKK